MCIYIIYIYIYDIFDINECLPWRNIQWGGSQLHLVWWGHRRGKVRRRSKVFCGRGRALPVDRDSGSRSYSGCHRPQRRKGHPMLTGRFHCQEDGRDHISSSENKMSSIHSKWLTLHKRGNEFLSGFIHSFIHSFIQAISNVMKKRMAEEAKGRTAHLMLNEAVSTFHILQTILTNEQFVQTTTEEERLAIKNRLKTIKSTKWGNVTQDPKGQKRMSKWWSH